jgi:hypothetical protein
MARPDPRGTLTPEIADEVVTLVRAGNYFAVAAEAVGVHRETLRRWLKKGEDADEGLYFELVERVRQAEALAEVDAVAVVREGGKAWIANMTYLERRHPDRWRRATDTRPIKEPAEKTLEQRLRERSERAVSSDAGSPPLRVVADD